MDDGSECWKRELRSEQHFAEITNRFPRTSCALFARGISEKDTTRTDLVVKKDTN